MTFKEIFLNYAFTISLPKVGSIRKNYSKIIFICGPDLFQVVFKIATIAWKWRELFSFDAAHFWNIFSSLIF